MPDGYLYFGLMPELVLPRWSYTMDTVMKENLEGTEYTDHDFVESKVDDNDHPIKKKNEKIVLL